MSRTLLVGEESTDTLKAAEAVSVVSRAVATVAEMAAASVASATATVKVSLTLAAVIDSATADASTPRVVAMLEVSRA